LSQEVIWLDPQYFFQENYQFLLLLLLYRT
jgi:hypothetical protein